MMKLTAWIFLGLVAATLLSCAQDDNPGLASVNGDVISESDLMAQWRVLRTVRPDQPLDDHTRRQLLDQLVRQSLLVKEAEARGYGKDPNLASAIEKQRLALRAELEKQIEDARAQLATLDQAVRTKALIDAMLADYGKAAMPGDKEIAAYYYAQKEKGQSLPPLEQVKAQVAQQILLDRLVKEIQGRYEIIVDSRAIPDGATPVP